MVGFFWDRCGLNDDGVYWLFIIFCRDSEGFFWLIEEEYEIRVYVYFGGSIAVSCTRFPLWRLRKIISTVSVEPRYFAGSESGARLSLGVMEWYCSVLTKQFKSNGNFLVAEPLVVWNRFG